jgi:hypothetical protein
VAHVPVAFVPIPHEVSENAGVSEQPAQALLAQRLGGEAAGKRVDRFIAC